MFGSFNYRFYWFSGLPMVWAVPLHVMIFFRWFRRQSITLRRNLPSEWRMDQTLCRQTSPFSTATLSHLGNDPKFWTSREVKSEKLESLWKLCVCKLNCLIFEYSTSCVSSPFPCDWCVDGHRCTHDTAENCRNDILVTGIKRVGPSIRSGISFF